MMVLLCCSHFCEELNKANFSGFLELTKDLGPIIVGIIAVITSYLLANKTLSASRNDAKRDLIQKKLSEFYSPFLDLRKKSGILYNRFQEQHRAENQNFSTLRYLLDGNKFTGNDDELLKEILEIGKKCEKLIHKKAGLIDDENLRVNVLPNLTTHYLILRMAYEGKLSGEKERFRDLSFPRDVDELIENKIVELEERLKKIN